jgi:hypothetical protein
MNMDTDKDVVEDTDLGKDMGMRPDMDTGTS